ncbi:FecR domain-containing protein [Undibacterium sp. CY18W]|uniref:FecR domain-containing protein n=1 Tax=Undibacterium hunanense TaxID=2762292 RepID=A0ABR6ZJE7_9BURK|nr:FecR domain-containing protein [Undibacterium hunanense]MBC3916045.1 FecR domain-containing protein [Undibacterium hunanense]
MKSASEIEEQAANWLARRDSGNWSDEQETAMQAWINEATAHRIAYLRLKSVWQRANRLSSLKMPQQYSVPKPRAAFSLLTGWRIAAGVLVIVGAGTLVVSSDILTPATRYGTVLGESKTLALPDGSRLALNTNTHIRTQISSEKRLVWLDSGEAYFEVAHDTKRPFVIEAGKSRVTVLGTKFSVRRDGDQIKVNVVDGRVQVSNSDAKSPSQPLPENAVVMTKNETLETGNGQLVVNHKTTEQIMRQLDWRQGKLVLDDMTLAQAVSEFNRYNQKKLVILDASAGQIKIAGSFNVDNVDGFARLLHQGFGLKIEIGKDEIKILR